MTFLIYPYVRTPENEKEYGRGKKGKEKERKRTKRKERKKNETKTSMRSGRRPTPDGTRCCCLLVRSVLPIYDICPVNGQTEGRHKKIRRKARQEEGRDRAKKQNQQSYVQLVGQGHHKRPKGGQKGRTKLQ